MTKLSKELTTLLQETKEFLAAAQTSNPPPVTEATAKAIARSLENNPRPPDWPKSLAKQLAEEY